MALITVHYANLTRSVKLMPWPGGHKVLFAAICDKFPTLDNVYKSLGQLAKYSSWVTSSYVLHPLLLTLSVLLYISCREDFIGPSNSYCQRKLEKLA